MSGAVVRMSHAGCVKRIAAVMAQVSAEYEPGLYPWASENAAPMYRRGKQIANAIDALAGQEPTVAQFDAALGTWRKIQADMLLAFQRANHREVA